MLDGSELIARDCSLALSISGRSMLGREDTCPGVSHAVYIQALANAIFCIGLQLYPGP